MKGETAAVLHMAAAGTAGLPAKEGVWLADTGASDDIADLGDVAIKAVKAAPPGHTLEAVGLEHAVQSNADVIVPELGPSEAIALEGTPNCASVGKRVS